MPGFVLHTELNGLKEERRPHRFHCQYAAEGGYGNPRFGRNHMGRAATRPSHVDQWRPGAGETLFGPEFLVRGTTQYNEPGVFMSMRKLSISRPNLG